MKVLTAAQMREVDRLTTERYGVPSLQLMENAGARVVEFLAERFSDLANRRIVVLCGKGNNGGDGLVAARLLKQHGADPAVYLFAAPEAVRGDAAVNLKRCREAGGTLEALTRPEQWQLAQPRVAGAEIILDALLGTGLDGPVEGLLLRVIEDVNTLGGKAAVVAVDIPSGLPSDSADSSGPAVRARATVTFTAPKLGLVLPQHAEHVGELQVRSIGTPPEFLEKDPALKLHWLEPEEFRALPLRRPRNTHKGSYGHALIVAGSRGKTGAAVLAGNGALRVGAGLTTVATPANCLPIVASHSPELMTEPLEGTDADSISLRSLDYGRFTALLESKSVLALGPGLSTHPETQQFVQKVVADCPLPLVLDADGLNAFAGRARQLCKHKAAALAVTPHPGEMARLLGCTTGEVQAQRLAVALRAAADWNAHVVLKGFRTVIATPDGRAFINSTGNPGMATGGTGDVLTGMLAGLTAQLGIDRWETVLSLGVYLHGLAGDFAAAEVGEAPMIASDLVRAIPQAFAKLFSDLGRG
jgi:hydroxyethylthiazole kinase-like uncharacterized protein yjeF